MTPAQRELARHALGLPSPNRTSFRNRYFAPALGHVTEQWRAMVAAGEAEGGTPARRMATIFFRLTLKGAQQALEPGESLCFEDFPR